MSAASCELVIVQVAPWDARWFRARCFTCGIWVGPKRDYQARMLCHNDTKAHRDARHQSHN